MPIQFQGVGVGTLPGAREGRPDGLHALLEPAAAALKDPQPHVGPGLPEEREMNAEPVVFPGRGAALAEKLLQARVQRPVGERTEGAEHGVQPLAQLIAVHRRFVQRPEYGKLEYAGAITPHAAPNWWLHPVNPGTEYSVCLLYIPAMCQDDSSDR